MGRGRPSSARETFGALRQADAGPVARRGDVEGTGRAVRRVRVRLPTRGRIRDFFFNDTATTEIYTLSLHGALPICRGHVTHVGAVDRDGRRERTGVSLGLGDPRARLHADVERDRDGRQDADDRDDDHQLDEGEASLVPYREPLLRPPLKHWVPPVKA